MRLIEVKSKSAAKRFLDAARILNQDDPLWVCPLDSVINSIFDPKKNDYYRNGKSIRWILLDSEDQLIGRVAAFFNRDKAMRYDPPAGGMGFFECIDQQQAADVLFDACINWLKDQGMGAMDGPVNFGENDSYWGLLIKGFTQPAFGMNYNPPYYKTLFENYGFKPFFEQESKHIDLTKAFPERFWKIAEWVIKRNSYTFEHFRKSKIKKYAADVVSIYNEAWVHHEHFSPLNIDKVLKSFNEARSFIVEEFIWFAYHEGKPIGFLVMLPDINQVLKLFNGKMNAWDQIRFYFLTKSKRINRSRITILGVVPKYQGKGVESAIFWHLNQPLLTTKSHYKEIEISWVGDFNPKMKATMEAMKAGPGKTHITYRKYFAEESDFQKAASIL
jgi:GNAT superfamily N-acetyltransferase